MSLILCPECGTKISDKATQCPHCGFQSADSSRPISEQDKFEISPTFEYDIEGWQANRGDLSVISWTCQEKCSHKTPKILDRQISGGVMRELL
jgi:ribosomal protein L37E